MTIRTINEPPGRLSGSVPGPLSRAVSETGAIWPGLAVSAAAAAVALAVGILVPVVSPLLLAIILGAVYTNVAPIPDRLRPGLAVAAKRCLRLGIVLLGAELVITDILDLGAGMVAVIVAVVVVGITTTMLVGGWIGVDRNQRLLIACGFSICGAAAVAAVDGVADVDEREVATTVGLVVVFGTVMIPTVPLLGGLLGLSTGQLGLWAGGSIHEVAQVIAAAGAVGSGALGVAVVVKLGRVLMLAPVMAWVSLRERRSGALADAGSRRPPIVPLFVVGFLALAIVRTTGLVPVPVLGVTKMGQTLLLATAMFALGTGVHVRSLRKARGRPLVLAAISTVTVAATALGGILLVGA